MGNSTFEVRDMYDHNIATQAAALCGCAYGDVFEECAAGFDDYFRDDKLGVDVFTFKMNSTLFVIFKGSSEVKDWIQNFKVGSSIMHILKSGGKGGIEAHRGFVESWTVCNEWVRGVCMRALSADPHTNVVFTGHSAGGAIATLAMIEISSLSYIPFRKVAYTFASPRVLLGGSAKKIDGGVVAQINRVKLSGDPVTRTPSWIRGYRHIGELWLLCNGTMIHNPSTWRETICAIKAIKSLFIKHGCKAYYTALKGCGVRK